MKKKLKLKTGQWYHVEATFERRRKKWWQFWIKDSYTLSVTPSKK